MAIVTETLESGLIRTYSDAGYYIHGGSPAGDYVEAIDPADAGRTYTETETKIAQDSDKSATDTDTDSAGNAEYEAALAALKAKYGITE
ncbi:hypothetical protein [Galactobacillus timonensis]|uniref:hypothetical protein n=1 Tax=Galactobacillus timonensis TaxID=2041840 RepID=UPI000C81D62B|nr:hypothetical protein [Galactobacillus timonensis]